MANGFFLYRWFRDVSITRKLYFTVGAMALLVGVELFVLLFSLSILSSLRAYVGGEGLWSKAQKDAVFHLYRYGVSGANKDYELFRQFMRVPMGDARTRRELMMNVPDMDAARRGFLEGRNHPDDIDGMISLFIHFDNVSYIKKAVNIWGEAQAIAMPLMPIAETLRQEINSPRPSQERINQLLASIYTINEQLTALEDEFSFTLGEGSRWLERVVLRLLFITALTVDTTGLLLAISVSRGIQTGLTNIIRAANSFSTGELGARAKVLSHDEIGLVANSFNEMADNLQVRVKELAELNRDLKHQIGERERAEQALANLADDRGRAIAALHQSQAALRRINETLETRVADRTATLTKVVEALHTEAQERERVEAALRQRQKMEAVGQLTAGVAHDFSNLLQAMMGGLELLQDRIGADPDNDRLLAMSIDAAKRGARLTHHLLAFSRRQALRPTQIDIDSLLCTTVAMLGRTLGPGILIRTTEDSTGLRVFADPTQLEACILNLALNARDAMPGGGTLTIRVFSRQVTQYLASEALPPGDYVVLIVQDTGEGIDGDILDRVFEPFFTTKDLGDGSGLGLSMVLGFARQSGGDARIASTPGKGTRVEVFLPRATEDQLPSVTVNEPKTPLRATGRILLVDDVSDVLVTLAAFLQGGGFQVTLAHDAEEALRIVTSPLALSAIVTDFVMPGMSGAELMLQVARVRPALPGLIVTGYPGVEGLSDLPERIHVLHKPFPRAELLEQVHTLLDQSGGLGTTPDLEHHSDVISYSEEPPTADDADEERLCWAVLHAIADVARHSPRRQTEVAAALNKAGILLNPQTQARALDRLIRAGLVEQIVRLNDGGVLVTVTSAGLRAASP
jgi:signal transduction histidine kinase/CheY-like chemotaxis protein